MKKKIKIRLNRRGMAVLLVFLFVFSTATTFFIAQAVKRNRIAKTALADADITPVPTPETEDSESENEEDIEPAGEKDSQKDSEPQNTVTPTPKPAEKAINFDFPKSGTRPVAVMIDNEGNEVLPQGGIAQAQIVYEMVTEYGNTRYMALFWNNLPEYIGPVRSTRHYFLDYAMEYDAVFAHMGGSDYAYRDLESFEIDNIDGITTGGVFWDLTNDSSNYHDTYTGRDKLSSYISKAGYSMATGNGLPFAYNTEDVTYQNGDSAKEVFIKYGTNSSCGYYYDEEQKNYKRTRLGEFQKDRNTNDIVRAKNIIVMFVENKPIEGDKYGRQELSTTGSGNGYYISNGVKQDITWVKSFRNSQTKYLDANKNEIKLNPGQTWIQIVPLNVEVRFR